MNEEDAGGREAGTGGAGNEAFYRRRLDRSPEKQEFFQLPENDRRLICDLRSAMHSVYEKFTKLREQVDEREAAEPQTTPDLKRREFVDMYSDPAVNEELRQRFSGSRRSDPNMDLSDPAAAFTYADGFSREKKKRRRSFELEDVELSLQKEKQKRMNLNRRRSIKRTADGVGAATESDDEIAVRKTSGEDKTSQATLGDPIPPTSFPSQAHPGYFHPYCMWPPTSAVPANGPNQMPLPMSLVPPGYAAATAYPYQFGVVGPMPFVYAAAASGVQPAAVPHDHEVPVKDTAVDAKQDKRQASAEAERSLDADAGHELLMSFARRSVTDGVGGDAAYGVDGIHVSSGGKHCLVCAEGRQAVGAGFADTEFAASHRPLLDSHHLMDPMTVTKKHVTGGRAFRNFTHGSGGGGGGGDMAESRHSISSRTSRLVGFSRIGERPLKGSISQKLDQQISMLLEELEKSKDQNIQLRDELMASEKELDSLRFICQNKDAQIRSQATGKLSIMVQEIYRAQKERDVAMMNRINRANAERDEALLRLKRLQQKYSEATMKQESSTEEKKLNEVLTRLQSESQSGSIEQKGAEIVEAIKLLKEQRWQTAAEEMRAILEERDMAVAKCRDLESELSQVRHKVRGEDSSREQRQVLQGRLFAVEHERNLAVEQIKKLEDEVLSLRIYYNLHGSLSQEVGLFQQFSKTLDGVEKEMRTKEEEVEVLRIERQQLLEQTKTIAEDKRHMMEEIQKANDARKTECSKNEKLQRLVTVLRRKINSLGIKADEPE